MSVAAVIKALHGASIQPTGREIAEALWLAQYLAAPVRADDGLSTAGTADAGDAQAGGLAAESPPSPAGRVSLSARTSTAEDSPIRGHPIGIPAIPGLHQRQDIQRAFRPLRRYGPSRRHRVIDEDTTAAFIANTGIWTPVTRPARERWFDAVLVIDTSPSMDLWLPLIADLRAVLVSTGAFRDVRTWRLKPQQRGVVFPPGLSASARSPRELIDGAGRRLFFVVTDGAADGWHDNSATSILSEWGSTGPVAVLQPLPERMWTRTGLATVPVFLSANTVGPRNSQLHVDRRRRRLRGTWIPVLGIEPNALRSWAHLVTGSASAVPLAAAQASGDHLTRRSITEPSESGTAVDRFRASSSPEAYQLAVCLSDVSLTLPIMRLVQHAVVPDSAPSALAEVILGGLVSRTSDNVYEFRSGVREELRAELRRSEAAAVSAAVSDYIARHAGESSQTFHAVAHRADGPVAAEGDPFGRVPAATAARLGLPPVAPPLPENQGLGEAPSSPVDRKNDQSATDISSEGGPEPGHGDTAGVVVEAPDRDMALVPREPSPVSPKARGSGRLGRPDAYTPFFLSYAHIGPSSDEMAKHFYNILRGHLQTLVHVPVGTSLGFFDQDGIYPAKFWDQELGDALGTCQVLVPLMCPPYLNREWCGKEWNAFTQRERAARPGGSGSPNLSPILPVRWSPVPYPLPQEVAKTQFFTPNNTQKQLGLVKAYEEDGLFRLLEAGDRDAYGTIIWQLAKRIQQIYYSQHLKPRVVVPDDLRNVFAGDSA
jgi:hypothetical protein